MIVAAIATHRMTLRFPVILTTASTNYFTAKCFPLNKTKQYNSSQTSMQREISANAVAGKSLTICRQTVLVKRRFPAKKLARRLHRRAFASSRGRRGYPAPFVERESDESASHERSDTAVVRDGIAAQQMSRPSARPSRKGGCRRPLPTQRSCDQRRRCCRSAR